MHRIVWDGPMSSYNKKKNLAVSLEQTFSSAMYLLEITH